MSTTMEPFVFEWKMPLSKYKECKVKERLWSIAYTTPQYLPLKFYLRLFPHGDDEENSEFISYFLFCEPPNGQTITLNYNLYIQDENARRIAESPWEGEFGVKHQTWGKRRFCRRPIISAGADGDRYITFGCTVEVKNFNLEILKPKKVIIPSVPVEEEEDDGEEKSVAEKSTEKEPEVFCIEEEESVTEDGEENNAD
uniref:MATH domain-containing protein n=1 Tax=Panagrolaimus superbus TaxID=310955 RepID=A0A914YRU6_9BILA